MKNWLNEMCSTAFMPHGQCYLWQPELVGLHTVADALIGVVLFFDPGGYLTLRPPPPRSALPRHFSHVWRLPSWRVA